MAEVDYKAAGSVYEFTVKDNKGQDVSLEKYRGHVLLIVNIASKCGLTATNNKELTELKAKYEEKGERIYIFEKNISRSRSIFWPKRRNAPPLTRPTIIRLLMQCVNIGRNMHPKEVWKRT